MATRYWLGGAVAIPEVWKITVAGTWATGDTAWVAINGKELTLTVGATATIDQIGADIVDMINGAAANSDETRSALGDEVGEFAGLTATYDSTNNKVVITGASSGRPCGTITAGENTPGGDGTFAVDGAAATTNGTGPNFYSNADNWSNDSIPAGGDDVVFDHQAAASCLYGLDQSAITPLSVTVAKGFRYAIGLPEVNRDSASYPYDEHQNTYLTYARATAVTIDASGAQMIKLDAGTGETAFTVFTGGITSETGTPPVLVKGSHASNTLTVVGGNVGYCFESGVTGTLATLSVGGPSSPQVDIGSGVTITTINHMSGTLINRATGTVTTLTQTGGTYEHRGGTITTANLQGGTFAKAAAFTITTAQVAGGTLDCTKHPGTLTITNCHVYAGSNVKDPQGTLTLSNGLKLYCKPSEATLDLIGRRTYTIGAI